MANLEAGQEVAGSRGYYLLGHGVMLNLVGGWCGGWGGHQRGGSVGGVEEVWTDWFERNAGKLKRAAHSSLSAAYSLLQDSLRGFWFCSHAL